METHIQDEQNVDNINAGTIPEATAGKSALPDSNENTDEEQEGSNAAEHKKYHSSAMYAASKWHNTVSHVKAHSHKSLDL